MWDNGGTLTVDVLQSTDAYFLKFKSIPLASSANTVGLLAGDINGDGLTDIVQLLNESGSLSVNAFLSTGTGFHFVGKSTGLGTPTAIKFFAGDMNGDGRADIIKFYANGTNLAMTVLQGMGSGWFIQKWSKNTGLGTTNKIDILPLDVNRD